MFYLHYLCISLNEVAERCLWYFSHCLQEGCNCTYLKPSLRPQCSQKEIRKPQTPFCGSEVLCNTKTPPSCSLNSEALCCHRPRRGQEHGGLTAWRGRVWPAGPILPQQERGGSRASPPSTSSAPPGHLPGTSWAQGWAKVEPGRCPVSRSSSQCRAPRGQPEGENGVLSVSRVRAPRGLTGREAWWRSQGPDASG